MSKGLTPLEVSNELKDFVLEFVKNDLDRRFIQGSFDIIEKELRGLEIIKEKKVNVPSLITLFKSQTSYEDYEQLWDNDIRWQLTKNWDIQFSRHKLTQEEYDLLKGVLL